MLDWILATALTLSPSAPAPATDPPPPPSTVMALPPELEARFRRQVLAGGPAPQDRLQRLADFVFSPQGLGMAYADDATLTIPQAYAERRGNCLTFTLLFVALARAAGLQAHPQAIDETLAWRMQDSTLFLTSHVNTAIRVRGRTYIADVARNAMVARHRPRRIDDAQLLADYYDNLAVAEMEAGRLASATAYADMALRLSPSDANAWSNAGVIAQRLGDDALARSRFARALALDAEHTGALFNLAGLLQAAGDPDAAAYRTRLERAQQEDPLFHFLRAVQAQRDGDYAQAIAHYRRAIDLHPREYRFHAALAQAYALAGDDRHADRAFARARRLGGDAMRNAVPPTRMLVRRVGAQGGN